MTENSKGREPTWVSAFREYARQLARSNGIERISDDARKRLRPAFVSGYKAALRDIAKACDAQELIVDLGHVPKMNDDERQCARCERVVHEDYIASGLCSRCEGNQ